MCAQRILDTGNKIAIERPISHVEANAFDLSHDVKLSTDLGYLTPACVMEVLPGDQFHITTECLTRLQALISPVMHRMNQRSEWFFVPTRLLWANWEDFISPQVEGSTPPAMPYFANVPNYIGNLGDYLGLPAYANTDPDFQNLTKVCALPHYAVSKIISDWYTDEDLVSEGPPFFQAEDGDNSDHWGVLNAVSVRNKDRDYFTSAKPWAQKGPAVTIPVGSAGTFPNVGINGPSSPINTVLKATDNNGFAVFPAEQVFVAATVQDHNYASLGLTSDDVDANAMIDPAASGWTADTSALDLSGLGGTIEELRTAEALQKFLEADSRGGTRYIESMEQHWGVYSSDARLQRAEYIGSTFQPIVISEVLNTTGTSTAPQGAMAGHGIAVTHVNEPMHYRAEEHGYLICIASVIPVSGYYQGQPKMFNRFDRLDFPWPEFANLGEQPILNKEIYFQGDGVGPSGAQDDDTFGYLPRYTEMRMQGNRVAGDFRTTLDYWHLAYKFSELPALTQDFILSNYEDNLERIFATLDTTDHILMHWFHKIKCWRKLPRLVRPSI
ncbi:major capsid protein VP1 [Microviridae Fen2266_11]|uniref:major capsid protein VP1 n=1 Tax=Microviridae Fen2266_11 TaxID=1655652 RepID=UPI00063D5DFD|nr:major capsid protein VP1 [Microviridae Fen2266_11]AKI26898.1 major capsid protein VP1 [Microviridae Fen2266_11]